MGTEQSVSELRGHLVAICLKDSRSLGEFAGTLGVVGWLIAIVAGITGLAVLGAGSYWWVGMLVLLATLLIGVVTWLGVSIAQAISSRVGLAGALALAETAQPDIITTIAWLNPRFSLTRGVRQGRETRWVSS